MRHSRGEVWSSIGPPAGALPRWEGNMDYKLYRLDRSGHIISGRDVVARDDLAALLEAEKDCERFAVEVWQGGRRVARIKIGNAPLGCKDRASL